RVASAWKALSTARCRASVREGSLRYVACRAADRAFGAEPWVFEEAPPQADEVTRRSGTLLEVRCPRHRSIIDCSSKRCSGEQSAHDYQRGYRGSHRAEQPTC